MGGDKTNQRFSERERGTHSRLGNEADADETAAVDEMDALLAEQLAKEDWLGEGSNVRFMIINAEYLDSGPFRSDSPRQRRVAANKLLRIYQKLLDLAKQAPRDADGVLQCYRIGNVEPAGALDYLVPWTDDKPHSVDEILRKDSSSGPRTPLFSRENLLAWTEAANMPELPPPTQKPRRLRKQRRKRVVAQQQPPATVGTYQPPVIRDEDIDAAIAKALGKPPPQPAPEESPLDIWLIKTPGMSFLSEGGRVLIYSAALRVLLQQRISDERAAEIVRAIRVSDDRIPSERKDRFEGDDCGVFLRMSLHPSFFEKLSGFAEFKDFDPKNFKQEIDRKINNLITEMFPDFSPNERFFCATKLMVDRARMGNIEGYSLVLGKTYPPHGWVFIGFLNRESGVMSPWPAWLTPDCKIFIVNERESMLEGFRQGVLAAAGGALLGYAMIAIGGAAIAAPEAIAAVGELSSTVGAAAGRLAAPVLQGAKEFLVVNARGAYIWLGQNWAPVMAGAVPITNIIARIDDAGLDGFLESLYKGDWDDIVYNWATLFEDVGQVLQARGQMSAASTSPVPSPGDDEPPPQTLGPAIVNAPPEDVARPTQRPTTQTLPAKPTQGPTTTQTPPDQTRTQRPALQVLTNQQESDLPPILIVKPSNDNAPKPAYQPNAMVPGPSQGKLLDPGDDYFRMTKPNIDPLPVGETDRPVTDIQSRMTAPQLSQIEAERQIEPAIIVGDKMVVVGEEAQGAQGVVAARQTGTGGSNRATKGKAASSPNRSTLGNRNTGGSSRGTPPPAAAAPGANLDRGYAKKVGLKGNEPEWVERSADRYGEEMDNRRSKDPKTASVQAHVAAQDRLHDEDYNNQLVFEEPTGFSGPKTSRSEADIRKSDVQINRATKNTTSLRANIAAVVDFKRTAFLNDKGALVTDLRDKTALVETDQIQAYELLYRELGVPVFIINARRQIFAPDLDRSAGWILVGSPVK